MKHLKQFILTFLCCCSILFITSCGAKKVDYKEVGLSADKETLVEAIGSEPNEEKKEEDGSTTYHYKKSQYLDYVGTMEYHEYNDVMLYSRWTYTNKKDEKITDAYTAICNNMKKEYGKGRENKKNNSTTYDMDDKSIVVAYSIEDPDKQVCITTMMK